MKNWKRYYLNLFVFTNILFLISTGQARPVLGQKILVTSASEEASAAGTEIYKKGGNAVDAAVATALALSVTRPYYAALGGGGFAVIKIKDKVDVLDFRETAPQKTHEKYFLDKAKDASQTGGAAVGVPGIPMGLYELQKKYGKLHWSEVFAPAIKLAEQGFVITGEWAEYTEDEMKRFNPGSKTHFTKKGEPYKPGDTHVQKSLARALKELRTRGINAFYSGQIAKDIVDTAKASGSDLTLQDLKSYKVRWLSPLKTTFNGYDVYLMPPPSSGGVVIATALNLTEKIGLKNKTPMSVDELHLMGEVLARSFRARSTLGDPDFHINPIKSILSEKYLNEMAKSISEKSVKKLDPIDDARFVESYETTHLSVMTAEGEGVAMTVTLNGAYGSGVTSEKFGIALNNEMDDFTTRPGEPNMFGLIQGQGNLVQAGKRPLSSMSPTIVMKDGKLHSVIGSPGGPRIISGVYQILYRTLVSGWNMDRAIQNPRVHHQFLPHKLFLDPIGFAPETIEGLKKKGHDIVQNWGIAKTYGIQKNAEGYLEGGFDSRGDGGVVGY